MSQCWGWHLGLIFRIWWVSVEVITLSRTWHRAQPPYMGKGLQFSLTGSYFPFSFSILKPTGFLWYLRMLIKVRVTNKKFPIQGYHVSQVSKITWEEKMVWVEFKPSPGLGFLWSAKCITNTKYVRNEGRHESIKYGRCSPLFLSEEAPRFVCLFIFRHYFGALAQSQSHLFTKVAKLYILYGWLCVQTLLESCY